MFRQSSAHKGALKALWAQVDDSGVIEFGFAAKNGPERKCVIFRQGCVVTPICGLSAPGDAAEVDAPKASRSREST